MSFGGFQGQSTKKLGETGQVPFDFASCLASGETLSGATVEATVYSGEDSNPSAILGGAATVDGSVVTQRITDGVVGCVYALVCNVVTSLGQNLEISSYLAVTPDLV